jgi:signal transduction histidine kinase
MFAAGSIVGNGYVRIVSRANDKGAEVLISDNGPGIPPEKLERIFDPTFSNMDGRVGMELGLPLAFKTIRDHGGDLLVASDPGEGTTFTVTLPLS